MYFSPKLPFEQGVEYGSDSLGLWWIEVVAYPQWFLVNESVFPFSLKYFYVNDSD